MKMGNGLSFHVTEKPMNLQPCPLYREECEEIGIDIQKANLTVVHVMHSKTARNNINIFMTCTHWTGEIINKELEKCDGLRFFDLKTLPPTLINYIANAMTHIENKSFYSEEGWESSRGNRS